MKTDFFDLEISNLLNDSSTTDFCLNGAEDWYIDQGLGLVPVPRKQFDLPKEEAELLFRTWVVQKISAAGKTWDAKFPYIDFILNQHFRAHALFPPLSRTVLLSLRRLPRPDQKVSRWEHCHEAYTLLKQYVAKHENGLICGATGSGKTTLLNDLCREISENERIIALEDTQELAPGHPHFLSLVTRNSNADGYGQITIRDLLRQCLRMRPDRILLGECRGPEVLDLLQVLNTGHRGSLATIHANSARDALRRLELLIQLAGSSAGSLPPTLARDLIANGIQWIAHVARNASGLREIVQIIRIEGKEGEVILTRPSFNSY